MSNVQEIINRLENGDFDICDLEHYLESSIILVKVNAIIAVLREKITNESILLKLNYISQNILHEPKVMGEWNTGHYAMAVLDLLNTPNARKIYNNNIKKVDEYTQQGIKKISEQILCMLKLGE